MKSSTERGNYNEIIFSSLTATTKKMVRNLVNAAAAADKVDEHGNWNFSADFDRKGRGSATNWDVYGYGRDYFSRKFLAVIQVRQFIRRNKNYYPNIKKSYFLLGRNEDNTVFAHPVSANVVHSAIKNYRDVVRACQSWIFGTDYTKIIRQGDLALIPVRSTKGEDLERTEAILQDSHQLTAEKITKNGVLYAKNPKLVHLPDTHPEVSGSGWFKVVVGNRARFHDFAAPTID